MSAQARAVAAVQKAKAAGVLPQLDGSVACRDCGAQAHHYDHRDYTRPLEVEPVCRKCNRRRGRAAGFDAGMKTRTLRIPDDLQGLLHAAAGLQRQSIQAFILGAIREQVEIDAKRPDSGELAEMLSGRAKGGAPKKKES